MIPGWSFMERHSSAPGPITISRLHDEALVLFPVDICHPYATPPENMSPEIRTYILL